MIAVKKKRILLADDETSVREAYAMLLGLDEHEVVVAKDGVEALSLFSPGLFDLVITDYEMPRMKGNELASKIRALSPSQPVIMITAFEPPRAANPVDLVVQKPLGLIELREAIATVIGDEG